MTITTTDTLERYVGDGSQTAWPITFPFFTGEDVKACIVNSSGEQVNLVYGTDYTVTKSTSSIGGTLNYALADDVTMTIWLNLPITQGTDFYNTGPLNAEVLESSFDRLTLIAQQLQEASDRSVKVQTSSTATPEELLATLYAGRDAAVASASGAATSESNAAASETAAATSASAAAASVITAQAWAESESAPDPNDAESRSAKSWALVAGDTVPLASASVAGKAKTSASWQVDQETGVATVSGVLPVGLVACVATSTIPVGWLRYGTGTTLTGCDAAYPDFYAYVADSGNTCTLSAYATTLALTGQCGSFGLDEDTGTVRMPTVKFVQNALNADEVGTVNEAGLPNITAGLGAAGAIAWQNPLGAIQLTSGTALIAAGMTGTSISGISFSFSASRSSDLYGNSTTVQPDSVSHYYIIYAYNAAVSASVAQAAEFTQLLDAKADADKGIPSGVIVMWSGSTNAIPTGWALCNGEGTTPDLRNRFVLGAGDMNDVGDTGGSATAGATTLTVAQMPSHAHTISRCSNLGRVNEWNNSGGRTVDAAFNTTDPNYAANTVTTNSTGSSHAHTHTHIPPYYALAYIMKL